jgi:hypothetical protein
MLRNNVELKSVGRGSIHFSSTTVKQRTVWRTTTAVAATPRKTCSVPRRGIGSVEPATAMKSHPY